MTDTAGVTYRQVYDMMRAYKQTALLRTGIELGVFDALAEGPASAQDLSVRLGADERGTRILLGALAAIGLVVPHAEGYACAPGTEHLLAKTGSDFIGDTVRIVASDAEWEAMRRLPEAVRRGGTVLETNAETAEYPYWEDFATYATAVARPTADVLCDGLSEWAAGRQLRVLDIACGHGLYGYTVAQRFPNSRICSLDWGNVLPIALGHAERLGVRDRVDTIEGDMFEVPLGGPYDLVLITNVTHHFSAARAEDLLRRAASVLAPGGRVVVVGFTYGTEPPAADPEPHLFSLLMLTWTSAGEVHSLDSYAHMLERAGFDAPQVLPTPRSPFHVLVSVRR